MEKKPGFDEALAKFLAVAQRAVDEGRLMRGTLSIDPNGRRYVRIVKSDAPLGNGMRESSTNRSVYCFVDVTNGDILKAAGWKAPAKHARGNVFSPHNGGEAISKVGGIHYLG